MKQILKNKRGYRLMNDLLSLIIPVYNIDQYISRCLDSLINQTYKNLEIIIVDDGSTDNTASIIDGYAKKDKRIIIIHKKNEGVSLARIAGMEKANGKYVGFVDGDDIAEKDMFEMLMKNAKEYDADISHCGYVMDFPDGHSDFYYNTGKIIIQDNKSGLIDLLSGQIVEPSLNNKIYKKKIINSFIKNKKMDYNIKNLEDLLTNYYLFNESNCSIYEDICKYHYTLRKASASTKVSKNKFEDPIKVLRILMSETKKSHELYKIVYKRYIATLISNASLNAYTDIKREAKILLKNEFKNLKKNDVGRKLIYMSIGVIYLYPIYYLVRIIYNHVTGIDKKYKI